MPGTHGPAATAAPDAADLKIGLRVNGADRTLAVDGRRVLSCLTLAVAAEGAGVTTIEGLARGDALHPVQAAFVEHDAFQCGFCTPGQILSAVGLIAEGRARTEGEVREAMSGNLCRCGAYPNIVAAVLDAARRGR
jgi:xanthine dehydrogenase YagT iron-sulfur-binding subunit